MKTTLFKAYSHGHEEGWNLEIYEENGHYKRHIQGNSCLGGDFDETEDITSDEALEEMMECINDPDCGEDTDYLDIM